MSCRTRGRLRGSKKNLECGVVAPMRLFSRIVIVGFLVVACSAANGQAPAPPAAPVQQAAPAAAGGPSAKVKAPKSDATMDLKSDKAKKKAKAKPKKKADKASQKAEG